jgi:hypothetical protein
MLVSGVVQGGRCKHLHTLFESMLSLGHVDSCRVETRVDADRMSSFSSLLRSSCSLPSLDSSKSAKYTCRNGPASHPRSLVRRIPLRARAHSLQLRALAQRGRIAQPPTQRAPYAD